MKPNLIEPGDIVTVEISQESLMIKVHVVYVPHTAGEPWILKCDDGDIVYVRDYHAIWLSSKSNSETKKELTKFEEMERLQKDIADGKLMRPARPAPPPFDGQSFSAKDWADAFCARNPTMDHGTMLGWFANAIMRGYDEAERRASQGEPGVPAERKLAEVMKDRDEARRDVQQLMAAARQTEDKLDRMKGMARRHAEEGCDECRMLLEEI
jgi:hypothetical protein